jgi:hypothetical protein
MSLAATLTRIWQCSPRPTEQGRNNPLEIHIRPSPPCSKHRDRMQRQQTFLTHHNIARKLNHHQTTINSKNAQEEDSSSIMHEKRNQRNLPNARTGCTLDMQHPTATEPIDPFIPPTAIDNRTVKDPSRPSLLPQSLDKLLARIPPRRFSLLDLPPQSAHEVGKPVLAAAVSASGTLRRRPDRWPRGV